MALYKDPQKLLVLLCHQLLENSRDAQWLLWNHSLPGLSSVVRTASANVDQGGNKSNNGCGLHSRYLKFLTRFHKEINPQKSSKDFGVQNPEKNFSNGANRHQLLENSRDTQWLLWNHSLPGLSSVVRTASANVDQGGNKSNNGCGLHSGFLKFLTRFHKEINPQKSSKDFGVQNPEKSSATEPPRTAASGHKLLNVPRSSSFKSAQI